MFQMFQDILSTLFMDIPWFRIAMAKRKKTTKTLTINLHNFARKWLKGRKGHHKEKGLFHLNLFNVVPQF